MKTVIVVCGVPGSGKTTFCRNFAAFLDNNGLGAKLCSFDNYEVARDFWDSTTFKISRNRAKNVVIDMIRNSLSSDIIIVDDIMYRRSMRKEMYQICEDFSACLCFVQIVVEVSVALERNESRDEKVDRRAIEYIFENFDPFSPENLFEFNYIKVDSSLNSNSSMVFQSVLRMIPSWQLHSQSLINRKDIRIANDIERKEQVIHSQQANSSSNLFSADLIFRNKISKIMVALSQHVFDDYGVDRKTWSKSCSEAKTLALAELRNSQIEDPSQLKYEECFLDKLWHLLSTFVPDSAEKEFKTRLCDM